MRLIFVLILFHMTLQVRAASEKSVELRKIRNTLASLASGRTLNNHMYHHPKPFFVDFMIIEINKSVKIGIDQ